MITEDYVSFETAKLLKEKGFNEPCVYIYRHDSSEDIWDVDEEDIACQKPTLQMAMKWLRGVHNIAIVVTPSMFWGKYNAHIYEKGNEYPIGFDGNSLCPSYEEACEVAIKYCLEKLI